MAADPGHHRHIGGARHHRPGQELAGLKIGVAIGHEGGERAAADMAVDARAQAEDEVGLGLDRATHHLPAARHHCDQWCGAACASAQLVYPVQPHRIPLWIPVYTPYPRRWYPKAARPGGMASPTKPP